MRNPEKGEFVDYSLIEPGFEAVYSGERLSSPSERTDPHGNIIDRWSVWTWQDDSSTWDREITHINRMQQRLGSLDDATRRIRSHVGGLVLCDSSVPMSIDEMLMAIGNGCLPATPFRSGCWPGGPRRTRTTQPRQIECMQAIEAIIKGYLEGTQKQVLLKQYPFATGFINRTYSWLGAAEGLTAIQRLMFERMLIPFEYFTQQSRTGDVGSKDKIEGLDSKVCAECHEPGQRGKQLDAKMAELAGLPQIAPSWEIGGRIGTIADPEKRELYRVCVRLAEGIYGDICDCHHNTFRAFENQIYGIAKGRLGIPTRRTGTERQRLSHLLFGYALALDKWLSDVPMHFLLLDLGHIDLGFDTRNEIMRVYAHLGSKTPVKEWLAACLWYNVVHNRNGGLLGYTPIMEKASELGVSVREWMDSALQNSE